MQPNRLENKFPGKYSMAVIWDLSKFLSVQKLFFQIRVSAVKECCHCSFGSVCPLPFPLSSLFSGLHSDAVWPDSGRHFHAGLQVPHVCRAGLRHSALQLRWQDRMRVRRPARPPAQQQDAFPPLSVTSAEQSRPRRNRAILRIVRQERTVFFSVSASQLECTPPQKKKKKSKKFISLSQTVLIIICRTVLIGEFEVNACDEIHARHHGEGSQVRHSRRRGRPDTESFCSPVSTHVPELWCQG